MQKCDYCQKTGKIRKFYFTKKALFHRKYMSLCPNCRKAMPDKKMKDVFNFRNAYGRVI